MVNKRVTLFSRLDDGTSNDDADLQTSRRGWKRMSKKLKDKVRSYGSTNGNVVENSIQAAEKKRREDIKQALLVGIDRDGLSKFQKSPEELEKIKNKEVRKFYERQNKRLDDWFEVDVVVSTVADDVLDSMDPDPDRDGDLESTGGIQDVQGEVEKLLPDDVQERRSTAERRAAITINVNVVANIVLLAGKMVAALYSGSLSLIASLVDSALDLLCTIIIWTTNKIVNWRLSALDKKFPVGRRRLKSLGTLVFGVIMVISFVQVLHESIGKLIPFEGKAEAMPLIVVAAMLATVVIKGVLWFGCIKMAGGSPQVQALAQDCRTDVVFNSLSLFFPYIGSKFGIWWLDPAGAGLLSIFIIYDWSLTCMENVVRLSGVGAEKDEEQKLIYLAYRFAPVVKGFKNITAYHQGDGLWVEYDVLLGDRDSPNSTTLSHGHDIAETLQYCAESLPNVERAFVSVDYDPLGPTGHAN